jgi:GntR family transcriptional regulator
MLQMLASIDIHSSVAVYVQIENQVRFAISSGKLSPGERLPSVRELSERLEVNPNTVAKAYRDLEVMGLLYTRRGMGVFVNRGVEQKCREECRRQIIMRMFEVIAEAKAAGMDADEVNEVVSKSLLVEGSPYRETPPAILALAKGKKKKQTTA